MLAAPPRTPPAASFASGDPLRYAPHPTVGTHLGLSGTLHGVEHVGGFDRSQLQSDEGMPIGAVATREWSKESLSPTRLKLIRPQFALEGVLMRRSAFFIGLASATLMSRAARASEAPIGPRNTLGLPMRAWVQRPTIIRQECPEWCWAASTAMIFAAYGHPIDQKEIVKKVFKNLACRPAGTSSTIASALSDEWTDNYGKKFQSTIIAAYDAQNNIHAINNAIIANELSNNHPLLYCNTHHAMVNVSVDFISTPWGPTNVSSVGVLDPWPQSPPYHVLSAAEMRPVNLGGQMMFLASVRVKTLS